MCRCISGNFVTFKFIWCAGNGICGGDFGSWTYFIYSTPDKEYEYDDAGIVRNHCQRIMDSVMGIIKYVADPETELQSITYWQLGSLTKVLPKDLFTVGPVIVAASVIIFLLRWRINILSLGDREAKTLGVSVTVVRNFIIICATLLTASAVCISGTIGWIGLVIPHFARMLTGPDNTKVIPASILMGAIFMVVIDTLARALTSVELPLSILTGIIGAPFYIIILARQRMKLS